MKVIFFGDVSRFTNTEELEIQNASTLDALITILADRFGIEFGEYLRADGTCFYLVNGRSILHTGGLQTPLTMDSVVQILPHVEAG